MEMFSPEVKELFTAFSSAQGEFESLGASDSGQYGAFSTVGDYIKAIRPSFKKYGLSVTQIPFKSEDGTDLVTVITHSSGQFMRSVVKLNPEKQTLQGFGASISYIKRYTLGAILGLDGEPDDIDKRKDDVAYDNNKNNKPISPEQFEILKAEIKAKADPSKVHKGILGFNKIERLEDLPSTSFRSVKSYLDTIQ